MQFLSFCVMHVDVESNGILLLLKLEEIIC